MLRYRDQVSSAWARVAAIPSKTLHTTLGTIEYADAGIGPPVLMSHGILGSHVEGVGMVRTFVGDRFRAIAPSRVGYFGSTLDGEASVVGQADEYALLLDALTVDRAIVVGYSAGGASAIAFALRHPDRVRALVLAASALPGSKPPPNVVRPIMRAIFGSDVLFWALRAAAPKWFAWMVGVPKDYRPGPGEEATIANVEVSTFPHTPRARGATFDMFVGNPSVNSAPIEELRIPTLVVHAADDTLAPYRTAVAAVPRIAAATFVTIERGGHLFLGHEHDVRSAVQSFLARQTGTQRSVEADRSPARSGRSA
jgi:pimeloyl-ACP methyl ester carboxylesterase